MKEEEFIDEVISLVRPVIDFWNKEPQHNFYTGQQSNAQEKLKDTQLRYTNPEEDNFETKNSMDRIFE